MKEIIINTYMVILSTFLPYIVWMLKQQNKIRDANSHGTLMLLKIQLIEYHERYIEQGSMPSYVYQNYCDLYEAYHKMGGNGLGDKMKEEVDNLKIVNHVKGETCNE